MYRFKIENPPLSKLNPSCLFDSHGQLSLDFLSMSPNESEWYAPWYAVLRRVFRTQDGFEVAPRQIIDYKKGRRTMFFIITSLDGMVVCVADIKPPFHFYSHSRRVAAYKKLGGRVLNYITPEATQEMPVVYGLSCIGNRFMIMKTHTNTRASDPPLDKRLFCPQRAPEKWWHCEMLTENGAKALIQLAVDIKTTLPDYKPALSGPVVLPDDIDSSDELPRE